MILIEASKRKDFQGDRQSGTV